MKNGGRILWNVAAICETHKTPCLTGRHLVRGGLDSPFDGPVVPFEAMVEYHPISAKDLSRLHQFGPKKSCQVYPRLCIVRGVNLERRHDGVGDGRI